MMHDTAHKSVTTSGKNSTGVFRSSGHLRQGARDSEEESASASVAKLVEDAVGKVDLNASAAAWAKANDVEARAAREAGRFYAEQMKKHMLNMSLAVGNPKHANPAQQLADQCGVVQQYAASPSLCPQGNQKWSNEELSLELFAFTELWKKSMTLFPHHCCMGINHMFALYTLTKKMQPAVVIESGVAAGHETWLLRQVVGPQVPIFSLDPVDPAVGYNPQYNPIGNWKDQGGMTTYLVGPKFQDFAAVNWALLIPDSTVRARTLVILDDHQSCVERFKVMQHWGFRWAFYEDNYPYNVATSPDPYTCLDLGQSYVRNYFNMMLGDAYSPNAVCGAPLVPGTTQVLHKDKFGNKCNFITPAQHAANLKYINDNTMAYFEFPPVFTTCPTARAPLLGQDEAKLVNYGLPTVNTELWSYGHLFPCFVDLKLLSGETIPDPNVLR